MADIFELYVQDDRSILFNLTEPIMQEDNNVTQFRIRIPVFLNNIAMNGWAWWLVYTNARNQKFSEALTLTEDVDDPAYMVALYDIGYGITANPGKFSFALEAIRTNTSAEVTGEWHTKTYSHIVESTLQGNQAEFTETETDIISALVRDTIAKIDAINDKIAQISESVASGTNLVNPELIRTGDINGVSITRDGDAIIFDGDATASGFGLSTVDLGLEAGKKYTIKAYSSSRNNIRFQLDFSGDSIQTSPIYEYANMPFTFTVPEGDTASLKIGPISGTAYDNDEYKFSIMEGTTNPSYSEYSGTLTAVDSVARAIIAEIMANM